MQDDAQPPDLLIFVAFVDGLHVGWSNQQSVRSARGAHEVGVAGRARWHFLAVHPDEQFVENTLQCYVSKLLTLRSPCEALTKNRATPEVRREYWNTCSSGGYCCLYTGHPLISLIDLENSFRNWSHSLSFAWLATNLYNNP